jgi:hypothetical protein
MSFECKVLVNWAIASVASGLLEANSSATNLMQATEQMQQTQMSFNLQYLMLQENLENDSREYTCLSNVCKKSLTLKNAIANIR